MVFKAVSGVQRDAYTTYSSSSTYSEMEYDALDVSNKYFDMYKNRIVLNWENFGPSKEKKVTCPKSD